MALRYNSPDSVRCTPDSVRCPREERLWNSPASGICSAIIHRTCPVYTGLSGEPAEQRLLRQRSPAGAFNARQKRAEVRHARDGAPDNLQYLSGVHWTSRRAQKSEAATVESQRPGDVAGAPDMSGVHRTVRCTIRQSATTKRLVWWLGL